MAVTSAGNAWAVGSAGPRNGSCPCRALIEHWNGTAWAPVPSGPSARSQTLSDVAASSARSAWMVGDTNAGGGSGLILHWDGTAWR